MMSPRWLLALRALGFAEVPTFVFRATFLLQYGLAVRPAASSSRAGPSLYPIAGEQVGGASLPAYTSPDSLTSPYVHESVIADASPFHPAPVHARYGIGPHLASHAAQARASAGDGGSADADAKMAAPDWVSEASESEHPAAAAADSGSVDEDNKLMCAICLGDEGPFVQGPYGCDHEFCAECTKSICHNPVLRRCPVCRGPAELAERARELFIELFMQEEVKARRRRVRRRADAYRRSSSDCSWEDGKQEGDSWLWFFAEVTEREHDFFLQVESEASFFLKECRIAAAGRHAEKSFLWDVFATLFLNCETTTPTTCQEGEGGAPGGPAPATAVEEELALEFLNPASASDEENPDMAFHVPTFDPYVHDRWSPDASVPAATRSEARQDSTRQREKDAARRLKRVVMHLARLSKCQAHGTPPRLIAPRAPTSGDRHQRANKSYWLFRHGPSSGGCILERETRKLFVLPGEQLCVGLAACGVRVPRSSRIQLECGVLRFLCMLPGCLCATAVFVARCLAHESRLCIFDVCNVCAFLRGVFEWSIPIPTGDRGEAAATPAQQAPPPAPAAPRPGMSRGARGLLRLSSRLGMRRNAAAADLSRLRVRSNAPATDTGAERAQTAPAVEPRSTASASNNSTSSASILSDGRRADSQLEDEYCEAIEEFVTACEQLQTPVEMNPLNVTSSDENLHIDILDATAADGVLTLPVNHPAAKMLRKLISVDMQPYHGMTRGTISILFILSGFAAILVSMHQAGARDLLIIFGGLPSLAVLPLLCCSLQNRTAAILADRLFRAPAQLMEARVAGTTSTSTGTSASASCGVEDVLGDRGSSGSASSSPPAQSGGRGGVGLAATVVGRRREGSDEQPGDVDHGAVRLTVAGDGAGSCLPAASWSIAELLSCDVERRQV